MENPFELILEKLNNIEILLKLNHDNTLNNFSKTEEIMDMNQVAEYVKLSKPTIYGLTSRREIPHYKRSKKEFILKKQKLNRG